MSTYRVTLLVSLDDDKVPQTQPYSFAIAANVADAVKRCNGDALADYKINIDDAIVIDIKRHSADGQIVRIG